MKYESMLMVLLALSALNMNLYQSSNFLLKIDLTCVHSVSYKSLTKLDYKKDSCLFAILHS